MSELTSKELLEWLDTAVHAVELNKQCQPYPESGACYRELQRLVRAAHEPPAGQYCEHGVRSDLRCFSCNPASSQPPPAVRYWEYLDKYAPDHVSEASAFLVKLMCDYADRRGSGEAKAAMIGTAVDFLSQWAMLQPCSTATKGPDVCSGCGHVFPIAPDHPAYGKPCPEEKCPRSGEGENHER
jgi:hypothetical protein